MSNSFGQDPADAVPSYEHIDFRNLPTVSSTELNSDDLTIAIATGPQNFVYTLSFGNGVQKRNTDGSLFDGDFITGLDSPFDIAVDSDGFVYIADFQAGGETYLDNGQVKIYDSNGNYIRSILTSYFRPMGIDVDENYVYIAEHNDGEQGPESTPSSRIRIVDKSSGNAVEVNNNVTLPYRIAVDSEGFVYVSQEGGGNPGVYIYDSTLSYQRRLSNIISPGSIVIDDFDFIHVVEYAGRIDFGEFISSTDDFGYLLGVSHTIRDAVVEDQAFGVKIFNPEYQLENFFKTEIHFPLDIAFNACDRMYIDDSEIFGLHNDNFLGHTFFPSRLEFDLEIYERTPALDITAPEITCPADIAVDAETGNGYAIVTYNNATATDICGVTVNRTNGLASGSQFSIGENIVEFTATDSFGNFSTCTFKITVNPAEETDEEPSFSDCPTDNITVNNDPEECGAIVTFPTPTATDEDGDVPVVQTEGPVSGSEFPVGTTTITFSATDEEGNTTPCSFSIIVDDNENPTISCPEDILETVAFGENGKIVNYTLDYSDNCGVTSIEQTSGQASGSEFALGDTINTFVITDDTGNTATCSFTVTIEEEPDTENPVIDCQDDVFSGTDPGECGAVVNFQDATATDNSGTVSVMRIDNTGYASGDLFPVGTTTIEFQATDEAGNTSECSFTISISDGENPEITCPSDIRETVAFGSEGKIVEYDLPVTEDNCSGEIYTRIEGIASGNVFPVGTTLNVFEVTDAAGNTDTCSFSVTIEEAEDTEAPVFDCPDTPIIESTSSGSCSGLVDIDIPTATDNSGEAPTVTQITNFETDGSQEFPVGDTTVIFEAEDAAGNISRCEIIIRVIDNENPQMDCVSSFTINLAEGETRTLSPDELDNGSADNCGITELSLSKTTFTEADEGTALVSLSAIDAAGNTNTCEVSVEVIVTTQETLSLNCPGNYDVFATENCQYVVPDFSEIIEVSPEGAVIEQSIPPGNTTITNADPFITLTATYEGQTETCDIYLLLQDEIDPVISCPADKSISLADGETYTLPDYRSEVVATDNCEIDMVEQQPSAGTIIEEDTEISFTVTDVSGNSDNCSFMLEVLNDAELSINCPGDKFEELNENCSFELPDYRDEAELFNAEGGTVTQSPEPGLLVTGSEVEVSLRVEKGEEFDECRFTVILEDNIAPEAICRDYEILLSDEQTVELDPGLIDNGSSDNCGDIELSLDKTSFTAADEGENIVTLSVTDLAGNVTTCEAMVLVTVSNTNVNQQPVPMDEEYTTAINTTLNVSAENGVLVNDTDPDGDELTAILETPTEFGSLELNADGSFSYTPNEDFMGQDFFTYQASDGELTSDVIFVSINVVDETADFTCNSQVVVELDDEGMAEVDIMQLYQGNAEGLNFSVSDLVFSCEDLGETSITLEYSGRLEGSCVINVMVMDQTPPELSVKDIDIDLDLEGIASISFEDIDNGSSDNCGVEYSLSQSEFTCKNLGANTIEVTATDSSGNTSTAFVNVRVFAEAGICSEILPGSEYIFLYPNPTTDKFSVATPGDVSIQRIEIFDNRGRFITARNFSADENEYTVELMPLQEAVYVLKIETNEGVILKRLIYKR